MSYATASPTFESASLDQFSRVMSAGGIPSQGMRIALNPEDVRDGLGRLVLTLMELLRELLERQALRRIEGGSLTDPEIERLGTTFLRLSEQMETMKAAFGLAGEDLNLDLGPLGKLL
jgi:hypothetical protein